MEEDEDKEFDEEEAAGGDAGKDLAQLTRLYGSEKLAKHTAAIKESLSRPDPLPNTPEHHEDYALVCSSNDVMGELENETVALTKYIRDTYAPRFPELEALIQHPLDYVRTVHRIGNEADITAVDLGGILPSATIMVVTVTATTTSGKPLAEEVLERVMRACGSVFEIEDIRTTILEFVETRMNILAPNLSVVVGPKVAALMMAMAGGLQELSRMPACNIQMMGSKRKVQNGMSTAALGVRGGVINQSPIVVGQPPDNQKKAAKLVSAKCALTARVDAANECPAGDVGISFKRQIEEALAKAIEPPPQKKAKALPAPDMSQKKKRGGKRARAIKEKYAMSEMMKQANRVQFGVQEEEVFGGTDVSVGIGSLGQMAAGGKIRVQKKEVKLLNQKAKERNGLSSAIKGHTHGLISSVVMNSTTGMVFEAMNTDTSGTVTPARIAPSGGQASGTESSKYFGSAEFTSATKKADKKVLPAVPKF